MQINNRNWSVEKLYKIRQKIDPSPQYQRGAVWRQKDNQLLIDTILREFDIPKLYLRKVDTAGYDYEVADGQQRLRAIWEFMDDVYPVASDCPVSSCAGLFYSDLPKVAARKFREFKLITAIAYKASSSEIRELFRRLQLGFQLSQPEIRNAISSQVGDVIRAIAANHPFFANSPFSPGRYKTDDLTAHAFLLELTSAQRDLKAQQLRDMYREHAGGVPDAVSRRVVEVLDFMDSMQRKSSKCISRKWGFVDVYYVVSSAKKRRKKLDPTRLAKRYVTFQSRRLQFVSRPEDLLTGKTSTKDRDLFKYIEAFKTSGGLAENVRERHRVLSKVLTRE